MLYEGYETEIPQSVLSRVVAAIPAPACLLGGWAVYYTVNSRYRADTGKSYHGSRDIDLGFHLERDATAESLRGSALAGAIDALKGMGFRSMGVRLFKEYHRETRLVLSEAKAKRTPSYNIFHLYVDLLVDNVPGGIKKAIGFTPFDEKMLANVFGGRMFRAIDELPARVILPDPAVLLAMKAASLPARTKDHKKHKDIMDMYALIWHSGVPAMALRRDVSGLVPDGGMARAISSIEGRDYEQAADALGVDREGLESVIRDFALGGAKQGRKGRSAASDMSYGMLIAAVKALHRAGANQEAVGPEELSRAIGAGARAARQCLSFLEGAGVVEAAGQDKYSLTAAAGVPYAEAHSSGDASRVAECTRDVIRRSRLAELEDAMKAKGTTREDLCKRIRALGIPGGKGAGGMRVPHAAGEAAILRLFEDAGLLERDARAAAAKGAEDGRPAAAGMSKPRGGELPTRASHAAQGGGGEIDDLAVLTVRGVGLVQVNDLETLRVAEAYLDMLRKRLQGRPRGESERADAAHSPP